MNCSVLNRAKQASLGAALIRGMEATFQIILGERIIAMDDKTDNLDQADEAILNPTVADETLEAAAVGKRWGDAFKSSADTSIPTYCQTCGCVS